MIRKKRLGRMVEKKKRKRKRRKRGGWRGRKERSKKRRSYFECKNTSFLLRFKICTF